MPFDTDSRPKPNSPNAVNEKAYYRKFFEQSNLLSCVADKNGLVRWVSPSFSESLGWQETDLQSRSLWDMFHPCDQAKARAILGTVADSPVGGSQFVGKIMCKDGRLVQIEWNACTLPDAGIGVVGHDLSARFKTQRAISRRKRLLEMAAETAKMGYWRYDLSTRSLSWPDTNFALLGLDLNNFELNSNSVQQLYPDSERSRIRTQIYSALESESSVEFKCRIRHADGNYRHIQNQVLAERSKTGKPTSIFGIFVDTTRYEEALAESRFIALHDSLTKLANRREFNARLKQALQRADAHGQGFAVVLIDLDNFKDLNDSVGYPIGDQLLQAFAQRLQSDMRGTDILARIGGDEFAIIQTLTKGAWQAQALCERIMHILREPFQINQHELAVNVSIGVSISPDNGATAPALLRYADIALYRAKKDGRSTYRFYDTEMDQQMRTQRALRNDIRAAIERQEFELHYQPVFDTASMAVSYFEALIRWNSPVRGPVSPGEFIPVAEESGLMLPIGQWALRQACEQASHWPRNVGVAVNVSAVEFKDENFLESVRSALALAKLSPNRLELEITETALLTDGDHVLRILHQLRELGVKLAMDDFGVGYSSLSYLRKFPFDKLKLDGSFVRNALNSPGDLAIVCAIAGMAKSLGLQTTAEGIETEEQHEMVDAQGYCQVQGFLHGRPASAQEIWKIYFGQVLQDQVQREATEQQGFDG